VAAETATLHDPASIEVMASIAPTDRAKLQALENAGADSAVLLLTRTPEHAALAELEEMAQKVF